MDVREAIEKFKKSNEFFHTEENDLAIETLEKQVPKKVIFEDDGEVLLCPSCGIDFMGSMSEPQHDPYYCFECGQALDWSQ